MTTMHLGTFDTERLRDSLPSNATVIIDGDSWEEWGEPLLGDEREAILRHHPVHVQIIHPGHADNLVDLAWLLNEEPGLLVPMGYHRQRGILASITPDDDWSEPILEVTDEQAKRWLARHPHLGSNDSVTDETVWRNLEWQDYLNEREDEGR